jgi:hypothetical protein
VIARRGSNRGFARGSGAVWGAASRLGAACALSAACGGATRDVVPETHDVRVTAGGGAGSQAAYAHVARRPLGFVALTRQVGLGDDIGARATEHLADALDACATNLAVRGRLVDGTIRLDATVAPDGSVVISHVTVAPGDAVAANALLCVVAPLKLTVFSADPGDAGARAFAIDASWGPPQTAPAR